MLKVEESTIRRRNTVAVVFAHKLILINNKNQILLFHALII